MKEQPWRAKSRSRGWAGTWTKGSSSAGSRATAQHVAAGEPLFSLEGDKATQDIESLETGILRIPPDGPKDGDKVAVGTLIGYLVAPGEAAPFETDCRSRARPTASVEASRDGEALAPSRSRSRRAGSRSRASPVRDEAPHLAAGPASRSRAGRRLRSDCNGSGSNGRIVERDIRAAAGRARVDPVRGLAKTLPSRPIRRTIAERMVAECARPPPA